MDSLSPMRLLVTGDRNWSNREIVYNALVTLDKSSVIIHGAARGLDTIAAECALELGLQVDLPPTPDNHLGGYLAQWKTKGRSAGPQRNTLMLQSGHPDLVWAFHDDLWGSRGTLNMVEQALRVKLPVMLYSTIAPPTPLFMPGFALKLMVREAEQMGLYDIPELGLPNHPAKCDCDACNEAYGKRKV